MATFMECTDEMYAHFSELVDAKEKEFADFPTDLKVKMQTSTTREEAQKRHHEHWKNADANGDGLLNEDEFVQFTRNEYADVMERAGWNPPTFNQALYRELWKALSEGEAKFLPGGAPSEGGISRDAMRPYMSVIAKKRIEGGRWRGPPPKVDEPSAASTPAAAPPFPA